MRCASLRILRIDVTSDNIYILIARVPIFITCFSSPNPNQVVQSLSLEVVEHSNPHSLMAGSVFSPPEPLACSFVERTPQHRDTSIFQQFQVTGHGSHIRSENLVFPSAFHRSVGSIESRLIRLISIIRPQVINRSRCTDVNARNRMVASTDNQTILFHLIQGIFSQPDSIGSLSRS